MFYKIDTTRITLREYSWGIPVRMWPVLLPILAILKVFRIRLSISTVVPHSIDSHLIDPTELPDDIRAAIEPLENQLVECGFVDPIYMFYFDPFGRQRNCIATYRHKSGDAFAQIGYRQELFRSPPKEVISYALVTPFQDGTYFETSADRQQMLAPPECKVHRLIGASLPELWRFHREELLMESPRKTILPVYSREETLRLAKASWDVLRDFNLQRGVYVPCGESERESIESVLADTGDENDRSFAAVYTEIDRLANRKAGWLGGVIFLLISVAIFMFMGVKGLSWSPLTLMVGVLFFHELGHFAAMSMFGYRNLRMFFIPLLGAAVSGKHYNVPGWKKGIVSLAGPVPGIALGIVLAVVALHFNWQVAVKISIFMLIINAFNLLPIMPLDGGQLMHTVLFSRHPVFDVAIRVIAAGVLIMGFFVRMPILGVLGLFMLLGVPVMYRNGKIVHRLRKMDFNATSTDGHDIPVETARAIYNELRETEPAKMNARTAASWTLNAFELLNARPPGWLGSVALIGVQVISFLAAVVTVIVITHRLGV